MKIIKRAVLQAAEEKDGWFRSTDLVSRVDDLSKRKTSPYSVGAYLSQLFEDGQLTRKRIRAKDGNYIYEYINAARAASSNRVTV